VSSEAALFVPGRRHEGAAGRDQPVQPARERFARGVALALLAGLVLGACKDDPAPTPEVTAEAGAAGEKKPAVDEKIANAVAAATEASARPGAQPAEGQLTPPPDGILSAEAAARELAPGKPAALVLGADGAAPRLRLGGERPDGGASPSAKITLSYRSGGSVMPTVELDLKSKVGAASVAVSPPATNVAAGHAEPAPAGAPSPEAASLAVRFTVASARPAESQPGRLPENAKAEIAKLNGSTIERLVAASGAPIGLERKLAGNNPDLEPLLTGAAEALSSALLPLPDVPVGAGAFWMVKSRETANGAAVLAYRMVKLVELDPSRAKLSVSTRRYLLEPALPLAGLPPHRVRRFESEGEATLTLHPGVSYPESADVRDSFMALVSPNDRPNQAVPVQSELSAQLAFSR
jgi:hypothetical protein